MMEGARGRSRIGANCGRSRKFTVARHEKVTVTFPGRRVASSCPSVGRRRGVRTNTLSVCVCVCVLSRWKREEKEEESKRAELDREGRERERERERGRGKKPRTDDWLVSRDSREAGRERPRL